MLILVLLEKIPFFVVALLLGYASLVIFDRTDNGGHHFYPLYQRLVLGAFSFFEHHWQVSRETLCCCSIEN